MAKVTISKAIELSGVSRSTFYTSYINQGKITVSKDKNGKKCIDTSELLRVFGELKPNKENNTPEHPNTNQTEQQRVLKTENEQLKKQLGEARRREEEFSEREQWYQSQISNLTDSIKLLEAPKHSRPWWRLWK